MKRLFYILAIAALATSCVTKAKYDEVRKSESQFYNDAKECNENLAAEKDKNKELEQQLAKLKAQRTQMQNDTTRLSQELLRVQTDCAKMQEQNTNLLEKLKGSKSQAEVQTLIEEIQALQSELMKREDALFQAERNLAEKQAELEAKNAKLIELTELIAQKEQITNELKDKIKNALTGFEGNGLEITTRNGRVYVSMDEKLLFRSGSFNVDARGKQAIAQIADVLAQQKDIDILVEGHTDNVPYNGAGVIIDNWDLSVKRATAIVRILVTSSNIDPSRIIASGRSQYVPVDTEDTPEARSKNRRTEIILNPNLDKLMQALY